MKGPVEQAIRTSVEEGAELPTPTGSAQFTVHRLDSRGATLLFGPKRTLRSSHGFAEGVADYLKDRTWLPIGANRDVSRNPETLDWYLKQHVARQTANYVAVLLHRAGVVDLITDRPARVRLSSNGTPVA